MTWAGDLIRWVVDPWYLYTPVLLLAAVEVAGRCFPHHCRAIFKIAGFFMTAGGILVVMYSHNENMKVIKGHTIPELVSNWLLRAPGKSRSDVVNLIGESARAKDKVGFTFKIVHSGTGNIYMLKSGDRCDETIRTDMNKVHVKVDTGLNGLSCSGLESGVEVDVILHNGEKLVTCTQDLEGLDFEFPLIVELTYDYEQFVETSLTVKKSGIE